MVTKRTTLTIFILVVMTLCSFAQVQDIPGWGKTKWGMKPTEVLDLYKAEGAKLCEIQSDKNSAGVIINSFPIMNTPYNVEFVFDDSKGLRLVRMTPTNKEKNANEFEFKNITGGLTDKYGAFITPPSQFFYTRTRQWLVGATTIQLMFVYSPKEMLYIFYQPTDINQGL